MDGERLLNKSPTSQSGIFNQIISSYPNFKSQFDLNSYFKGLTKKKVKIKFQNKSWFPKVNRGSTELKNDFILT